MTAADNESEILSAIVALRESLEQFNQARDQETESLRGDLDALKAYVTAIDAKVDAQNDFVDAVAKAQEAWDNLGNIANEWFRDLDTKVNEVGPKLDGIRNDLATVRGGHAHSAVLRNAPLIADALDCSLISEVPKGVIIGLAKIVASDGEPANEVDSFRNADLVLYVTDEEGRPAYIAVEASFTIAPNDVRRAHRNAHYLRRFTGLISLPVVAGVEVLPAAQQQIDRGDAYLYLIQRTLLEPD